jgi:hypothetical protein
MRCARIDWDAHRNLMLILSPILCTIAALTIWPRKAVAMAKESTSYKVDVIDALFRKRWNEAARSLSDPLVTLTEISDAIAAFNAAHPERIKPISTRNPANFFKDIVRHRGPGNQTWPKWIFGCGYTARQVTGENACFEFVPIQPGQVEPFPSSIPEPSPETPTMRISSVSMPLASRRLGRSDESWLIQVVVRLRIIDTHLALFSARRIIQVDHLQTGVKLGKNEIDAILLAIEESDDGTNESIVCCEAKSVREDVIEEQLIGHVKSVFVSLPISQNMAIPICVKTIGKSKVRVMEFGAVERANAQDLVQLTLVSDAIYELVPPVPGI